jgi:hypothetical protein
MPVLQRQFPQTRKREPLIYSPAAVERVHNDVPVRIQEQEQEVFHKRFLSSI